MENDTQKMFGEIMTALKGLDERLTRIESGHAPHASVEPSHQIPNRKMSIKEFLIEQTPTDDVQKTLAIGYFLETQEALTSFNKSDLERGFRASKEPLPSNINDKVNMSIKNGHMMEAEEKKDSMKAWVITRTGEEYIKNGFKKEVRKK